MYIFDHPATEQTVALTDYRYIGDDPYNYVYFNCDDDGTNCETWRILGVFEVDDGTGNLKQRLKLVRGSQFVTNIRWDTKNTLGENDWTNASLKVFLNEDYYNRTGEASSYGLKELAQDMIDNVLFYLGGNNSVSGTTEEIYAWERGNMLCGACNLDITKITWTGKIGLMYPSDEYYAYRNGVNATCYDNPHNCGIENATTGWVYKGNILEGQSKQNNMWFLSPDSDDNNNVFYMISGGFLANSNNGANFVGVRPVVYLKSSVQIDSGTGTESDPYVLKK